MRIKKITKLVATLAIASAAVASVCATQINVTRNQPYWAPFFPGGEFTIYNSPWGDAYSAKALGTYLGQVNGFQTFCLEENEPAASIADASLSTGAIAGGVSGQTSPQFDPISMGTAWLYSQFAKGVLDGYDYDNIVSRSSSAQGLQWAIWWLEGEVPDPNNVFSIAVKAHDFGSSLYTDDANGEFGVYVVNMVGLTTTDKPDLRQSMLVYMLDGGSTVSLLGGAFACLGLLRRRA